MIEERTSYVNKKVENGYLGKEIRLTSDDDNLRVRFSVVDGDGKESNVIYAKGIFGMMLDIDNTDPKIEVDSDNYIETAYLCSLRPGSINPAGLLNALTNLATMLKETVEELIEDLIMEQILILGDDMDKGDVL